MVKCIYLKNTVLNLSFEKESEIIPSELGGIKKLNKGFICDEVQTLFSKIKPYFLNELNQLIHNHVNNDGQANQLNDNFYKYCGFIAFNVLTDIYGPEFTLNDQFDSIRRWIIYGEDNTFVKIIDSIHNENIQFLKDSHRILILKSNNKLYAFVNFYNSQFDILVRLSNNFVGNIDFEGYICDLQNHKEFMLNDYFKKSALKDVIHDYEQEIVSIKIKGKEIYTQSQIEYFEYLANLGDSTMMTLLGRIYKKGLGVEVNPNKMLYWYQKGIDYNNVDCMYRLSKIYKEGELVIINLEKSNVLFNKAKLMEELMKSTVNLKDDNINDKYVKLLNEFCIINNLPFNDKHLLQTAFTHSSYANENFILENNERLEFLGDGVLEIVVRDYLYKNNSNYTEGNMTKIKENYVDSQANYQHAKKLNLDKYLLLGNGVGHDNTSILGDAFEALIGAIYLDLGFDFVYNYLYNQILPNVDIDKQSYKNLLQEKVTPIIPDYRLLNETGPDHDKTFEVEVYIDGQPMGKGVSKKRKDAEKIAAKVALVNLENSNKVDVYINSIEIDSEHKNNEIQQEICPHVNNNLKLRDILNQRINNQKHEDIQHCFNQNNNINYKGRLQETYPFPPYVIKYITISESGPDHSKTFEVEVSINGESVGCGIGRKKKDAEQEAAKNALENLEVIRK